MEKQQNLIEKQVQAKRKPISDDAMMSLKNLNLKKFTAKAKSVQEVAQASGLEVVDTPTNGNCQYYAVAMALLNRTFELGEDQKALEALTAKLKKGILAASNHFFEEKYPHSSRMYLLRSINNHKEMKLTEEQSKTDLHQYFAEIASSTSSEMGCVRGNLWGSSETLRMMAKILQRKIFCVVAQPSFAEATYAYYDIKEKKQYGKTFTTAVERVFSGNDATKWLQALKTECNKMARTGISPLVILFTPGHYEWLRFSTHPKPFPQQDPEDEDSLMDIIADAEPSSEDDELMQADSVCVRQDNRSERQMDTERSTTAERQEEEDIRNFGGSRTEELKTFSTAGINGIAPGKRHELRELDWDNEAAVAQWTTQYGISKSTLQDWQLQLLAEGSQSTFTPSLPSTPRSEESEWAAETAGNREPRSVVEVDDHSPPTKEGIGRFKAASATENSSRASVRQIKQSWNSHQAEWGQQTATDFPVLPSTTTQWRAAVDAAPEMLMEMLSRFERPGYILSEMTDSIVDYWTRPARLECLLHCLEQMESKIDDASQKNWLLQCCKDFRLQAETDMSELNLYPREMWTKLEKLKYGNLELLRLCKKNMTQQLSRYIVVSTIYSDELLELGPEFKNPPPTKTIEHLHVLFTTLENRPGLQAILDQPDSAGLWTELEASLAASSNSQHDGYLGSESPSY